MNKVLLNTVRLNVSSLNCIGERKGKGGISPAPPLPDIPTGYSTFVAIDGEFYCADGAFYVKL